jgi:hypothetical protein
MSKKVRVIENAVTPQVTKSYLIAQTDEETGEIVFVPKYLYVIGSPKKYRYNSQNGQFNINGQKILLDSKGVPVTEFSFQPIAWRIFEENMFERGHVDKWCEIFFIDDNDCVSTIMFNNTTLEDLTKLAESLFYDRITLADVILTVKPEKKETKKEGEIKSWFIGRFSYDESSKEQTAEYKEFAKDYPIYRYDTVKDTTVLFAKSDLYYVLPREEFKPLAEVQQAA